MILKKSLKKNLVLSKIPAFYVFFLHNFFFLTSNTYEAVRVNSDVIWKFHRYHLIQEFSKRPWLPLPLSLLINAWDIVKFFVSILKKCCDKFKKSSSKEASKCR